MNFDLDALRTMVVGTELGGYSHAAVRLNRSASAVSMQLRKLENQSGQRLFKRNGRGLVLTEAGDIVLQYARRMLALNDELGVTLGAITSGGTIRVGMPQDLNDTVLPTLLARYSKVRPTTHVEVRAGRNYTLADEVSNGRLDIALAFTPAGKGGTNTVATVPTGWFGGPKTHTRHLAHPALGSVPGIPASPSATMATQQIRHPSRGPSDSTSTSSTVVPRHAHHPTRHAPSDSVAPHQTSHPTRGPSDSFSTPSRAVARHTSSPTRRAPSVQTSLSDSVVPLVVFDGPCLFRDLAIAALSQAGRPWRLAMTTPSLASLCCGVQAGLGVTVRTAFAALPRGLTLLPASAGLPALPTVDIVMYCAADPSPAVQTFKQLLLEVVGRECQLSIRARTRKSPKAA